MCGSGNCFLIGLWSLTCLELLTAIQQYILKAVLSRKQNLGSHNSFDASDSTRQTKDMLKISVEKLKVFLSMLRACPHTCALKTFSGGSGPLGIAGKPELLTRLFFFLPRNQTDRGSGWSSDSLTPNSGFCCLRKASTQDSPDLRTLGTRGCSRASLVGGLQACSGSCGQKARVRDPPGTVSPAPPRACGARWRLCKVRVGVPERSHAARPTPMWRLPPGWTPASAGRVAGPACPRPATPRAGGSGPGMVGTAL